MIGQQLIKQNNPSDHVWVGLKERVRVRVRVISVRVRDHILPVMGEHEGLAGVLHAQRTVHLLHMALCASTGGAIASTGGAGWGVYCCRVCVLYSHSSTARCGDTGFSKTIPVFVEYFS